MRYRVRLLAHPVVVYSGHSFERAAIYMDDYGAHDRILEYQARDGWRTVMSVELGHA